MKIRSKAVHAGRELEAETGAITPNISMSTTFKREVNGTYRAGYQYTRGNNPTRNRFEKAIASLENGLHGLAFSSGMGAISSVFQMLKSGDHILLPNDIYYAVREQADIFVKQFNIDVTYSSLSTKEEIESQIKDNTKLIWMETPSNPLLDITDIEMVTKIAKEKGILTGIDNTWATPILQSPLTMGVDIVMHSSTKYIGGHSDVLGGVLVVNDNDLNESLKSIQKLSGAVPSPFDCWLLLRSLPTMPMRVLQQSQSALELSQFLENHEKIDQVNYPGLNSHRSYEIASKQMKGGFGGMISFLVTGGESQGKKVANSTKLIHEATSLGGIESLIEHRSSVEGPNSPTPKNLLRFSVGLEDVDDLIEDLDQALKF